MADTFESNAIGMESPVVNGFAVTPDNGADLAAVSRGIYVGISGDLTVDLASGDNVALGSLAAGVVHPLRVKRVYATGTTASQIVALY